MSTLWKDEFNRKTGTLILTAQSSYWAKPIYYQSVGQTLSISDSNPSGTMETRRFARTLLDLPDVKFIGFSGGRVSISVDDDITYERAYQISQLAIDILIRFKIYAR